MPKVKRPARRTGAALRFTLNCFGQAPPGNPNLVFLITKGKSSDDAVVPAAELRKRSITTFVIGLTGFKPASNLGDVGYVQKEISIISFSSALIFGGRLNGLVTISGPLFEGIKKSK